MGVSMLGAVSIGIGAWVLLWVVSRILTRRGQPEGRRLARSIRPFIVFLVPVWILIVFVGQPFYIPSGSMIPTLSVGEVIFVQKFAYGLRLPWVHWKILDTGEPRRGDVVVFRFPGYECSNHGKLVRTGDRACNHLSSPITHQDWIKRVIGLPGDRLSMRDGHLTINGHVVGKVDQGLFHGDPENPAEHLLLAHHAEQWTESLPGASHGIVTMAGYNQPDAIPSIHVPAVVPAGCYIVMGDNRNDSIDSRWWGCVPEDHLIGKATTIVFNRHGRPSWMSIETRQ